MRVAIEVESRYDNARSGRAIPEGMIHIEEAGEIN